MPEDRLTRVFNLAYECLREKINGGRIKVDNEASLQLQFAAILKSVGELLEVHRDEFFSIELERPVTLTTEKFIKSNTERAKIDIFFSYTTTTTTVSSKKVDSCAIEIKYFRKKNHREPNNRYDVFADIHNLENYGAEAQKCFMVVATDHDHYVNQKTYSPDTCDFDFRHGKTYKAKTQAIYRTRVPYGKPIELSGSYCFNWDTAVGGLHFMQLAIQPHR